MAGASLLSKLAARWRLAVWGLVLVLGLTFVVAGGGRDGQATAEEGKTALPADLARVSPDSFFVASARVADIWNSEAAKGVRAQIQKNFPELFQEFEKLLGVGIPDIERITMVVPGIMGGSEPSFLIATNKALEKDRVLKAALPERTEKNTDQGTIYIGKNRKAMCFLDDKVFVVGDPNSVQALLEKPAAKEGPLSPVLRAAAGKHAAVAGMNPEPLAMLIDQLPAEAEPFKPLLAAKSSLLTVDLSDKLLANLRGNFANAEDAEKAEKAGQDLLQMGQKFLGQTIQETAKRGKDWERIVELLKFAEQGAKDIKLQRKDAVVEASAAIKADLTVLNVALIEAVQKIRESAKRIQSANNLKQIALAMHNFHDTFGRFPAAANVDKDGKPLLSWRVHILPFVEQDNLYKQFHLDEPWDSEHNKKLLAQMPKLYQTTEEDGKKHLTRYQGFAGKGAFFDGAKGIRIADITDGTSNTIMVAEAAKGVPWTKPDDIPFDKGKVEAILRLGGVFKDGFNAAFCDGSVRFIKKTIKEDTLRALVTIAGGEVIGADFDN